MSQYRAFIKSRTDPSGKSFTNANSKVSSFTIKRDLLSTAQSSIELFSIPTAIDNGDIVGIYDEYGTIIYNGIVSSISENTIKCNQMVDIFSDNWVYRIGDGDTLEEKLKEIITTDFCKNEDVIISSCFQPFEIETVTQTEGEYPTENEHTTKNFASWIYQIYEDYDIVMSFNIPFNEGETPKITIGKNEDTKITLANNAISVLSITPTSEVTNTNKLIIYSKDGEYRETWYASPSGITDNPKQLDRLKVVKTKIVYSDDEVETLKSSNLPSEFYNHKITVSLSLKSKLYNFWGFTLGQKFKIIYNGTYYDSILTGYSLSYSGATIAEVEMTFGKARINLENKLYKLINR